MKASTHRYFKYAFSYLVGVVKVTMLLTWLPFIRGLFDGGTYQWGFEYFGYQLAGIGTSGDYAWLILLNMMGLVVIYAAYMSTNRFIFYLLAIIWLAPFIYLFADAAINGDLILYGDTLGIAIDLAFVALPFLLFTLVAIYVTFFHEVILKLDPTIFNWNKSFLITLIASVPMQFFLLRIDTYGITDPIGVLLTIAQCLLLSKVFKRP